MSIRNLLIIVAVGWLMFSSCEKMKFGNEFLEKPPGGDVTIDTIFNSIELSERFLWNAYSTLPYGLNLDFSDKGDKLGMDILESLTDLNHSYMPWGGANQLYYNIQYSASTETESTKTKYHYTKEQSWEGIRKGWIFI